jgi:aspartyl-tRNA(Asn)/glutamyl-tRNA(Gln) amidotransferase subunit C
MKVSALAKIDLNEHEIAQYIDDLNAIVDYATKLQAVDVAGISPMVSPLIGQNIPLREDIVRPSLSQADVLKEASQTEAGHFRVPRTVEG